MVGIMCVEEEILQDGIGISIILDPFHPPRALPEIEFLKADIMSDHSDGAIL